MERLLEVALQVARERKSPEDHDCCVWVQRVLERWSGVKLTDEEADLANIRARVPGTNLVPATDVWGPPQAYVEAGIADGDVWRPSPGWYVCQGWSGVRTDGTVDTRVHRGHTFLLRVVDAEYAVIVQSSRSRRLEAIVEGFRAIDSLHGPGGVWEGGVVMARLRNTLGRLQS